MIRRLFVMATCVLLLLAGPASASSSRTITISSDGSAADRADAVRRSVKRDVEGRGRKVEVEGAVGQMTVRPSKDSGVHVEATLDFWSNSKEYMSLVEEKFDVQVRESGDSISVVVEMPEPDKQPRSLTVNYDVKLTLAVPTGTPLEIDNRYGKVSIEGIRGSARVRNNSGDIELTGAKGTTYLESRYGGIVARDIDGPLEASSSSGAIQVERASADAILSSQYADVTAVDIKGRLEAKTSSGAVRASKIGGDARIVSSYGDVEVTDVTGGLEVDANSGAIRVKDVKKSARLNTSYSGVEAERIQGDLSVVTSSGTAKIVSIGGKLDLRGSYGDTTVQGTGGAATIEVGSGNVTASDIGGDLTIENSYGAVRASDVDGALKVGGSSTAVEAARIAGAVTIQTSYAGVGIQGAGGAVMVRNQSGAVTVSGLTGGALTAKHDVRTSYADVRFEWPAAKGLTFSLESTYGSVKSDLPGRLSESGSRTRFEGANGDGRASATILADNGSVTLRSQ